MKKLETLLTSLIQRGWKPFDYSWTAERVEVDDWEISVRFINSDFAFRSIRELVVLESGLWQFCVEQKYASSRPFPWLLIDRWGMGELMYEWIAGAEYRIMRSSLIPEEELPKFLVDNIIIKWNSK